MKSRPIDTILRRQFAAAAAMGALIASIAAPASAQGQRPSAPAAATPAKPAPAVTFSVRDWTRYEHWSYFEPQPGGGDPTYGYISNRLQFGLQRQTTHYDVQGTMQYVQLGGLPANATGPGQLGLGAAYYVTNLATDPGHLYVKYLSLTLKRPAQGLTVRLGRIAYASGAESASGVPKIEAVKRQRVDSRLVGEFEWAQFQRSFDGARVDVQRPAWQITGSVFHPTQGGFERRAGVDITRITLVTGALTFKPNKVVPGTEWQLFANRIADSRHVSGRPDNSGLAAGQVDVGVNSYGTTLVGAYKAAKGQLDTLAWLVGQGGNWYGESHRAYAFALEAGYQWPTATGQPWVRGGVDRGSGDSDPHDARHETFFPVMPTVRKYSLSATYATANLDDRFVQLMLRPTSRLGLRADVHRLRLTNAADLWYSGSGATQASGAIFGYSGRPSKGSTDFGIATEGSADYTINRRWSINAYLGVIRGGDIVTRTFAGHRLIFGYVENVLQF